MNQAEINDVVFEAEQAHVTVDDVLGEDETGAESTREDLLVTLSYNGGDVYCFTEYDEAMDFIDNVNHAEGGAK